MRNLHKKREGALSVPSYTIIEKEVWKDIPGKKKCGRIYLDMKGVIRQVVLVG